jgi:methionine sulfoxide reductase heme-binding subunit
VHYWWGVKSGVKTPLAITVVLGLLLVARPVLRWRQQTAGHQRAVVSDQS